MSQYFPLIICLLDCAAIVISYIVAVSFYMETTTDGYALCPPFLLMVILLLYQSLHTHGMVEKGSITAIMGRVAAPCLFTGVVFLLLASFGFLPWKDLFFLLSFLFLGWLFLVVRRIVLLVYVRREQKKGNLITRLLLVGTGERGKRAAQLCEENPGWGIRIVGFLSSTKCEVGTEISNNRVIGVADDLSHILESNGVDALFFADWADEGAGTEDRARRALLLAGGRSGCATGWGLTGTETLCRSLCQDASKRSCRDSGAEIRIREPDRSQ
jgi:FlaA1/EpsC-like NDP-sugar epimerase